MKPSLDFRTVAVTAAILVATGAALTGQDSLSTARDLYAGAAYEEALLLLNRLRSAGPESDEAASAIEQYRALCFLALGRAADADQAIAAVVQARPLYQPSDADVSPRLRQAFREVRKRVLPGLVQDRYAMAKAAYDRKEWGEAERRFRQVIDVLNDADIAPAASQPPLSDLRTLATGFYDLSAAAAAPPLPPPPPPLPAEPVPALAPVVVAGPPRVYTAADRGVVAPVPVRQTLPPFPVVNPLLMTPSQGSLEVVIDESGRVESAMITVPISTQYDRQVLAAARRWEYTPATVDGKPVKYRKTIQISVKP